MGKRRIVWLERDVVFRAMMVVLLTHWAKALGTPLELEVVDSIDELLLRAPNASLVMLDRAALLGARGDAPAIVLSDECTASECLQLRALGVLCFPKRGALDAATRLASMLIAESTPRLPCARVLDAIEALRGRGVPYKDIRDEVERVVITQSWERGKGLCATANDLGMKPTTLASKLDKLCLRARASS